MILFYEYVCYEYITSPGWFFGDWEIDSIYEYITSPGWFFGDWEIDSIYEYVTSPGWFLGNRGVEFDYNLYKNYPNPFNPETMIKFSLKERSNVTLDVYNIAGQKVAELVTGEMEKGMYEKRFNGIKLSSGVYIFRLNAQSLESTTHYAKTMKALLLK